MFVKIPNVPCKQAICTTRHCKLYSGPDNRVSKLYNCSNKPVNASEERLVSEYCTVFFYLSVLLRLFCIINTLHVGVDYLIIFYYAEYWGGLKIFLEGWTFCLGGGVIANIGRGSTSLQPPPPHTKSVYVLLYIDSCIYNKNLIPRAFFAKLRAISNLFSFFYTPCILL